MNIYRKFLVYSSSSFWHKRGRLRHREVFLGTVSSYGGGYYDKSGYATPSEFEEAMNLCDLQQFVYFKSYLKKVAPSIINAMKKKDWNTIARIYNGPDYKKNKYDINMEHAYNKYIKMRK